ncbi:MAG: NTP transferase domain-containing protein [Ignisphaera sp.]
MNIPVVVLAGGIGERIKVLTGGKPKALLYLAGKHLVEYTLENLIKICSKDVYLVVNDPRDFEDIAVKYGKKLKLELVQQKSPGIEGAIISIKDYIGGDFILIYGDVVAPVEMYAELKSMYLAGNYGVILIPEEEVESYTVAKLGTTPNIEEFVHGVDVAEPAGLYVVGGAYVLPKEFIYVVETHNNMIEALNYINVKHKLRPCIWSGWWIDVEYPWDLLRAVLYVLHQIDRSIISSNAKIASTAVVEGPVVIDDDVEIDHYAIIKGPAYIGKKSYIGCNSLIRNYVTLEGENVVGSYTEIVWSSIQRNTTIGSKSYIGFSVIGEGCTIEPGVVTLNIVPDNIRIARAIKTERRGREYIKLGAIIGHNSRVKAYTVLKPSEVVSS